MGFFDKISEPIFLKENSSSEEQLAFLEKHMKNILLENAKDLEQEIRNLKAGIIGEQQVAYELKNSHIPMYVLRDLYLEFEGLTAQIDYLIITRYRNFVIECKNLFGNIEITDQGDFIRNISYNGKYHKERIYSPITQNERHLELIKKIRASKKSNIFTKKIFENNFSRNYRSVVVLSNPKTIIDDSNAKKEISNVVIPIDRLITHIKNVNLEKDAVSSSEKQMMELANFFLSINKPAPDYTKKYQSIIENANSIQEKEKLSSLHTEEPIAEMKPVFLCSKCGAEMILRTATKGDNVGSTFYGCSQFPKCRNTAPAKQ